MHPAILHLFGPVEKALEVEAEGEEVLEIQLDDEVVALEVVEVHGLLHEAHQSDLLHLVEQLLAVSIAVLLHAGQRFEALLVVSEPEAEENIVELAAGLFAAHDFVLGPDVRAQLEFELVQLLVLLIQVLHRVFVEHPCDPTDLILRKLAIIDLK